MTPLSQCLVGSWKISFWGSSEARGRRRSPDSWPYSLSKDSASRPVKLISDSAAAGPQRPVFVWTHPGLGLVCLRW